METRPFSPKPDVFHDKTEDRTKQGVLKNGIPTWNILSLSPATERRKSLHKSVFHHSSMTDNVPTREDTLPNGTTNSTEASGSLCNESVNAKQNARKPTKTHAFVTAVEVWT